MGTREVSKKRYEKLTGKPSSTAPSREKPAGTTHESRVRKERKDLGEYVSKTT